MRRRVLAATVALAALVTLTGCGGDAERERYRLCLEHGGSYLEQQGVQYRCTLPR